MLNYFKRTRINTRSQAHKTIKAFTLVELSIVIVIIGLIAAGITTGTNVVNTARIRSTITDIETIKVALNNFQSQYNAFPGDMKNFASYFSCTDDGNTTCNGNGDGKIDSVDSSTYKENIRIFQHLTLAKLYPGSYNGVWGGGGGGISKSNTPYGKINNGKLAYSFWRWNSGAAYQYSSVLIVLGSPRQTADANQYKPFSSALTVKQAKSIDTKIDDGIARSGAFYANTGDDALHSCDSPDYLTQYNNELNCNPFLIIAK